jgi:hypothetical protein
VLYCNIAQTLLTSKGAGLTLDLLSVVFPLGDKAYDVAPLPKTKFMVSINFHNHHALCLLLYDFFA